MSVKLYCIDINRNQTVFQHPLMPLEATSINPVPFHMCWYLTAFTGENLQVFRVTLPVFNSP